MAAMRHWLLAIRPKTLSLSLVPVLVGNAMAYADGASLDLLVTVATLVAAVAIQIGTNLHNDAADFERGADPPDRLGPPRAAAQGWIKPSHIKRAALATFALAFVLGIFLASRGGWPIIAIGISALLAGWGYTAGPRPIAYSAFGELFVFLFFGLFAVTGSYLLQASQVSGLAWMAGAAFGCFAAAVLLVNNYRDLETDRRVGKLTLATYLGRPVLARLYGLLMVAPFGLMYGIPLHGGGGWMLLTLPMAAWLSWRLPMLSQGIEFNRQLAQTALLQMLFGLLLSCDLVLAGH